MTLFEIAIKNILRRKTKAFFVLAGISIGVATIVAVKSFSDTITRDINHKLEKYGANLLITPKTESLTLNYGGVSLGGISFELEEIKEEELDRLKNIKNAKNIAATGPMLIGIVEVLNLKLLLAGLDFKTAEILKPWWKIDGHKPMESGVLLGADVAELMQLSTGDLISIKGDDFFVTGILKQTGSQDDQLIFTSLPDAQKILGKPGRVSMVEVAALCQGCPIPEMVRQISEAMPNARVAAIQQVVESRMEAIKQFKTFSVGISGVVVLVGSLVVLVTMMSNVRERTEEIGIFRAVGFRKIHIMKIVFFEAGILSLIAGLIGFFAGEAGAITAMAFLIETPEHIMSMNWHLAAPAVLTALTIGVTATLYPALTASKMDPVIALKTI